MLGHADGKQEIEPDHNSDHCRHRILERGPAPMPVAKQIMKMPTPTALIWTLEVRVLDVPASINGIMVQVLLSDSLFTSFK